MKDSIFGMLFLFFIVTTCIITVIISIIIITFSNQKIANQQETINKLRSQEFECFNYYTEEELPVCQIN